jgi:hypothetical protein
VEGGSGKGILNLRIQAGDIRKEYPMPKGWDDQFSNKHGPILFERKVRYANGRFETEYMLPRQVPFGDTTTQVLLSAWDAEGAYEGNGFKGNIVIAGSAASGACSEDPDGLGPRISISGCERVETGGLDFPDRVRVSLPYCIEVTVTDSTGGVMSGNGPDEGTTLSIPGLLDAYHPSPNLDDLFAKSYKLTLDKEWVNPGDYLLKVSSRDVFGNLSARNIELSVQTDTVLQALRVYNVPNPMKRNGTVFHFGVLMPASSGDVFEAPRADQLNYTIKLFDQAGKLVRVFKEAQSGETSWDGRDSRGRNMGNGVYFYQVAAKWDPDYPNPPFNTATSKKQVLVLSR